MSANGFKSFTVLLLAQAAAMLGSSMANFALGVWAYQQSGAVTDYAIIAVANGVPMALLSPLAGTLVDRWNRKYILLAGQCVSMAVTATMALLFSLGRLEIWHITALAACVSAVSAFVLPTISASVPLIVGREQMGRANGLAALIFGMVQITSPALAGSLLVGVGMTGIFALSFCGALLNSGVLLSVPIPQPTAPNEASPKESVRESFLVGLRYLLERPGLLWLIGYYSLIAFSIFSIMVLIVPMVLAFTDAKGLGLISSAAGVGTLLGGALMLAWGGPKRKILGVLGGGYLLCAGFVLGPIWPSATVAALAAMSIMICFPIISSSSQTLFQHKIPAHQQGRIFGLRNFVVALIQPVAILASAPLADHVFEPAMQHGGMLADLLGPIFGLGKGRGAAVMISCLGLLTLFWTLLATALPMIRRLDLDLPDQPLPSSADISTEPVAAAR